MPPRAGLYNQENASARGGAVRQRGWLIPIRSRVQIPSPLHILPGAADTDWSPPGSGNKEMSAHLPVPPAASGRAVLRALTVRNWQSLRQLDLAPGRFTVIVGASSSGKSALVRALRAVASNVSGTSAITRGADAAAITVHTAHARITLAYSRGAWRYHLVLDSGEEKEYTKLNRSVPPEITSALGIAPVPTGGVSRSFAGQFDPPYLLVDSGATVARALGELTNVNTIYAAVREANRRRAAALAALACKQADLDKLTREAASFAGLPARLQRCEEAESRLARAARLADQVRRLHTITVTLHDAQVRLGKIRQLPPPPQDTRVTAAQQRLHRLQSLLRAQIGAVRTAHACAEDARTAQATEASLRDQLAQTLLRAGVCPTCQRATTA
jgi:energy-coupling factor transporter ATP-binding protein EcfA2